jgi:hypothetical protein
VSIYQHNRPHLEGGYSRASTMVQVYLDRAANRENFISCKSAHFHLIPRKTYCFLSEVCLFSFSCFVLFFFVKVHVNEHKIQRIAANMVTGTCIKKLL